MPNLYPIVLPGWDRPNHWAIGPSKEKVDQWIRACVPNSNLVKVGEAVQTKGLHAEEIFDYISTEQTLWNCCEDMLEGVWMEMYSLYLNRRNDTSNLH